jgi:thiamine biosynthesis lipoprotein
MALFRDAAFMPEKPSRTSRREFLKGKSALEAVGELGGAISPAGRDAAERGSPLPQEGRSYLVQVGRSAMACQFEVLLNAGQHKSAAEHAIAALDLIDQLEEQLSIYRHRSEVSLLNAVAGHRPVKVEPRLFGLLQFAQQLYEQTAGAFDITAGPLIQLWRKARREGRLPTEAAVQEALECVGSDKLRLDPQQQTVQFAQAGVSIDLGAIGKGYALDRCAELLANASVDCYLIHGGSSSVLARGSRQSGTGKAGWTVGVQHPLRGDRRLLELQLCDRAVGTSGAGTHQFFVNGNRYGHILDPRTGQPVDRVLSATVVTMQAAVADALSTSFYVMELDQVDRYCRQHQDVSALITTAGAQAGTVQLHTFNGDAIQWRDAEDMPWGSSLKSPQ